MHALRLAAATRCFQQPLKNSIATARDIGADAVMFDLRHEVQPAEFSQTGRKQLLHYLAENSLQVAATTFPLRRPLADLDQLEARLSALRTAMDFTYGLKANVMTARIGRLPDDTESEQYRTLVEIVNELARYGNRAGVTLAVTPMRESAEQWADFFSRITEGPIGLNCDPAVFAMAGRNASEAVRLLHEHVLHVAVRDGIRDMDGSGAEVAVGRGEVVWDELLAVLEEADYRGWMTAERSAGDDHISDIRRAFEYMRNVAMG